MTTILGDGIDLLILSIFSTFVRGQVQTCQVGLSNALSTNMTTILSYDIDLLIYRFFPPPFGDRCKHVRWGSPMR
ncbi:hypothetical protein Y032_0177g586 [Ancylostoma ceylanicum]|nr:hypothetical protein Y032_0177g586 [Ancylostoma ceylanicum]